MYFSVFMGTYMPWHMCGSQRTTFVSWFSHFTMWVIRLGGRCLYSLSHVIAPEILYLKNLPCYILFLFSAGMKFSSIYLLQVYICGHVCAILHMWLSGDKLFPPCILGGNSGHHAWWQAPLLDELPLWMWDNGILS